MDSTVTFIRLQSTRDQIQLAVNIMTSALTQNLALLDPKQADHLSNAIASATDVEQWCQTWQETLAKELEMLAQKRPSKR